MATGTAIGYRVWHCRLTGDGSWSDWRDDDMIFVREFGDAIAPGWSQAAVELNLPSVGDHVWDWRRWIRQDDQIAIVSDHWWGDDRHIAFVGFVADVEWSFTRGENIIITANGPEFRLARDSLCQVYGSYMKGKDGEVRHYSGIECVANPNGRPNSARGIYGTGDAAPIELPWFTHELCGDADYWRAIDLIEHLLWHYNADETWVTNPTFTRTERLASPIVQVEIEGLSLWAAIAEIADRGGYDVRPALTLSGSRPTCTLDVVKRGYGPEIIIDHQGVNADGSLPVLDTSRTNLFAARVAEATSSCQTSPIVLGGRALYEITVQLGQAWDGSDLVIPEGGSIVPPGQEKNNASNPWVQRYWTGGSSFQSYAEVGRRWDANTDGLYSDKPYELAVPDVAALTGDDADSWPQMAYEAKRMLTKLAATPGSAGSQTLVEFSVNGGDNWYKLSGYRVMTDRLAIWITTPNLSAIYPDGGVIGTHDLFTKLVLDKEREEGAPASVKMRLTCSVASPYRLVAWPDRTPAAGTVFTTGAVFDNGALSQVRLRADSSRFSSSGIDADEQADPGELDALAIAIQANNQDRFIESSLTLEWLDPVNTPLCGVVKKIGGIEVDLSANAGAGVRYPRIIKRVFNIPAQQTILTLDTERQAPVI